MYNISDLSKNLNDYVRGADYAACVEPIEFVNLENLPNYLEIFDAYPYYVTIGEKTRDYYICGYVSKDIEEEVKLDRNTCYPFAEIFYGRDGCFAGYINAANRNYFDGNEYPIIWYDIPKDEEIPLETRTMYLAVVVETLSITYESLDGSVEFQGELLYENKKFYDKGWSEDEAINNLRYIENVIVLSGRNSQNFITDSVGLKFMQVTFSFPLKCIEGITYISAGDYTTIYKGEDLKEKHEYILDESGNVLFKLEDIKYVFEEGE